MCSNQGCGRSYIFGIEKPFYNKAKRRGAKRTRPTTMLSMASLLLATMTLSLFPAWPAEAHSLHHDLDNSDRDHLSDDYSGNYHRELRGNNNKRGGKKKGGGNHEKGDNNKKGGTKKDRNKKGRLTDDAQTLNPGFVVGQHRFRDVKAFRDSGARCAQKDPTVAEMNLADSVHARWRQRHGLTHGKIATLSSLQKTAIVVDTYVHVVTYGDQGDVSDETIADQLQVLNDAYVGIFQFVQRGETTRKDNYFWWTAGPFSQEELEMKTALREGGPDALNIYFTSPGGGLLGWATFPPWYYEDQNGQENDGVVVLYSTAPLGSTPTYNEGDTLVHEVGHWLGLYHTFHFEEGEDGCLGQGDRVEDTPAQNAPTFGCPGEDSVNTCPAVSGNDMVENYMNYSDDACMNTFTIGQEERMVAMWDEFRKVQTADDDFVDDDVVSTVDDDFTSPTAVPTPIPTPMPTPVPTPPTAVPPTPPTPPPDGFIHVSYLTVQKQACSGFEDNCWLSRMKVAVGGVDAGGNEDSQLASGVQVTGWYQGSSYAPVDCTTGMDGTCYMPAYKNTNLSRIRFHVTGLFKSGVVYEEGQNIMTDINILQP